MNKEVFENKTEHTIYIIGGGAAGFFSAIIAAETHPDAKITILEKTNKILSKVKVSGGGRCNVTHQCFMPTALIEYYPRGRKELKQLFKVFQPKDTVDWFESQGVKLKTESDGRMFPISNNSQTIIDCFLDKTQALGIDIKLNQSIQKIEKAKGGFNIVTIQDEIHYASKIIVAIGGNSNSVSINWISQLGHNISELIPSLFTFNSIQNSFASLSGVSVPMAYIKIAGTKYSQTGPLLITHWGLSGPCVIKLSSWAAQYLFSVNYTFTALISWIGEVQEEEIRNILQAFKATHPLKKAVSNPLFDLPMRLWIHLCMLSEIEDQKVWSELPGKNINKLLENLIRCPLLIKGKTTFKEEFVTCGGVDLKEINLDTMESKIVPGLFFAGEILNIDGLTGGFNFQAAWTTGYIAGKNILK